jgi:membrane associated rhomboid family serine protease
MSAAAEHHTHRKGGVGVVVLLGSLAAMWVIEVINWADDQGLDSDGIRPHSLRGLIGVATAPFLHASFSHLMANSVPYLLLGVLIVATEPQELLPVLGIGVLASGLTAWAVSSPSTVIVGASGVVFCMLGYLLLRGLFRRSMSAIVLSIGVLVIYGSAIQGILPTGLPISWQGHLGGFIGGGIAAALLPSKRDQSRR